MLLAARAGISVFVTSGERLHLSRLHGPSMQLSQADSAPSSICVDHMQSHASCCWLGRLGCASLLQVVSWLLQLYHTLTAQ